MRFSSINTHCSVATDFGVYFMLMKMAWKIYPNFPGTIRIIKPEVKITFLWKREMCIWTTYFKYQKQFPSKTRNRSVFWYQNSSGAILMLHSCFHHVISFRFQSNMQDETFFDNNYYAKSFILDVWLDSECAFIHFFKWLFSDYMKRRRSTYRRHHEQVNIFLSYEVLTGANSHTAKASLKTN